MAIGPLTANKVAYTNWCRGTNPYTTRLWRDRLAAIKQTDELSWANSRKKRQQCLSDFQFQCVCSRRRRRHWGKQTKSKGAPELFTAGHHHYLPVSLLLLLMMVVVICWPACVHSLTFQAKENCACALCQDPREALKHSITFGQCHCVCLWRPRPLMRHCSHEPHNPSMAVAVSAHKRNWAHHHHHHPSQIRKHTVFVSAVFLPAGPAPLSPPWMRESGISVLSAVVQASVSQSVSELAMVVLVAAAESRFGVSRSTSPLTGWLTSGPFFTVYRVNKSKKWNRNETLNQANKQKAFGVHMNLLPTGLLSYWKFMPVGTDCCFHS